jgi:hypothetical protein
LAALTRDIYLLLPFIVVLLLLFCGGPQIATGARLRAAFAVAIAATTVVTPWMLRNFAVTNRFVGISEGQLGWNLWVGTWENDSTWMFSRPALARQAFRNPADESAMDGALSLPHPGQDRMLTGLALERIRQEPATALRRWITRHWQLWIGSRFPFLPRGGADETTAIWRASKGAMFLLNTAVVVFATVGIVRACVARSALLWFATPLLYTSVIYFPFHNADTRYSQPVFVFLIVFAAFELRHIFTADREPHLPPRDQTSTLGQTW